MATNGWWGLTRGETGLTVLFVAVAIAGLALQITRTLYPLGPILWLAAVAGNTTLNVRRRARRNREEARNRV